MTTRIGVLIVHGIGNQPAGYADEFIEELKERLKDRGVEDAFAFEPAHWGQALNHREDDLARRLASTGSDLDWQTIRREIILGGFGDAIAYAGRSTRPSRIYPDVQRAIHDALARLERTAGDPFAPLFVLSHSLGCQIVSNYLWDHQKKIEGSVLGKTPFTRGETIAGWITFGCNMPLFTLAWDEEEVEPVQVPGIHAKHLFPRPAPDDAFGWWNVYDPDDLLGFPLRGLNTRYRNTVHEDHTINTGTIFGAHTGYWTDSDFTKYVADKLAALAACLRPRRGDS